jgi:hypothetical protein
MEGRNTADRPDQAGVVAETRYWRSERWRRRRRHAPGHVARLVIVVVAVVVAAAVVGPLIYAASDSLQATHAAAPRQR